MSVRTIVVAQVGAGGWNFGPLWRVLLLAFGLFVVAAGIFAVWRAAGRRRD